MSKFFEGLGNDKKLSIVAGPCVFEGTRHAIDHAEYIREVCDRYEVNFIYKTSFDKANRTHAKSYRGVSFDDAVYGFADVQQSTGVEILTDVHEAWHCDVIPASILQIPAFLCRQTDLLRAAAATGKPVNVKKGQFLSPYDARWIVDKLEEFGCNRHSLTERGTTFGYNNLVVDMRGLAVMRSWSRVIFDCTHSVQLPGGGSSSGGDRTFAPILARAAVAVGVAGVFMEVHADPDNAPSDGANMIKLSNFRSVVDNLLELDYIIKKGVLENVTGER